MEKLQYDYDYVIVGSGFGGSVSAMRLSQKGYKVLVIEAGKRFRSHDFPKTNWNIRKFLWAPALFCYGIQRINLLRDVMVLSGAGVGGGSLVYANTLYIPPEAFFRHDAVKKLGGRKELLPYYKLAQKMLGVVTNPQLWEPDEFLRETAAEYGKADTFVRTPVGVFFGKEGEEGRKQKDPYFYGEGPDRVTCNFCGGCMVGCRFNAKNTLDKNYLYFAEKFGATILPETKVTDVVPLSEDGADGYVVRTKSVTGLLGFPRTTIRTRGVIFSAGVLGTINLLLKLRDKGRLPRLSPALGSVVRTNSEAILGLKSTRKDVDYSRGIAITSSVHPNDHTHIEPVRYSNGSDVMGMLATVMVDGGTRMPRALKFLLYVITHPLLFLRMSNPVGFAKKTVILLVMQTLDNSIGLVRERRWWLPFSKHMTSVPGEGEKSPAYIPLANDFGRRMARRMGAIPGNATNEVLLNVSTTAHILGGARIGDSPESGVIDHKNRVYGYENLMVCDGSMIPANLGVNPSLSITAFTERAMSFIPEKSKSVRLKAEKNWKVEGILLRKGKTSGNATITVRARKKSTGTVSAPRKRK